MIDPLETAVFPLSDVPRLVRPSRSLRTVFRWATDGIDGVRLETVRVGGTLCTSHAALREFFQARTKGNQ